MTVRFRLGMPGALLVLALSAWLVAAPHAMFDLADRNQDFDQHLAWAFQFGQGLAAGDPYPRWMPLGHRGLGEPALLYYSPGYYGAVALLRPLTDATWSAMRAVEWLALLTLGLAGWTLLRRLARPLPALLGAVACQASPMVFMLFNHFNGFPWASNAACFALLLVAALRPGPDDAAQASPADRHAPPWQPGTLLRVPVALAVAAMTLTHLVSTLMALICLTPALCWLWADAHGGGRAGLARAALSWLASAGTGLALAGVFLVPALASMDLISAREWTETYRPHDAFSFPTVTAWRYGIRWFGFQWPLSLVCLALSLAAAWLLRRRGAALPATARRTTIALLIVSGCALGLASELSLPLWLIDSPLRKVQFPHRFLFVASITATWALALSAGSGPADDRLARRVGLIGLAGATLLTGLLAARIVLRDGAPVDGGDTRIVAHGSYSEYTLPWQRPAALAWQRTGGWRVALADAGITLLGDVGSGAGGWDWVLQVPQAHRIVLPVLWFPAWAGRLDGRPHPVTLDAATGLVAIDLPAGEHAIALRWQRLPAERAGAALSAAALLACGLAAWRGRRLARQARLPATSRATAAPQT
jgi:hypothetical protein